MVPKFRNFEKIYISCKSTFFPFDPFSYKKKNQITPPPKIFPVLIKFDTAHIFISPAIQREGVYSICPCVRTVSALLTEELLEKIMLAKTKHKKLWKFY
jgi:hypothetical protein